MVPSQPHATGRSLEPAARVQHLLSWLSWPGALPARALTVVMCVLPLCCAKGKVLWLHQGRQLRSWSNVGAQARRQARPRKWQEACVGGHSHDSGRCTLQGRTADALPRVCQLQPAPSAARKSRRYRGSGSKCPPTQWPTTAAVSRLDPGRGHYAHLTDGPACLPPTWHVHA